MKHLRLTTYILLIIGMFILNIPFVVAKENGAVVIKSVNVSEKSETITVDDIVFNNENVSSNITFNQLNDFVTLELEVSNTTDSDFVLDNIYNNIDNEYFKVESTSKGITIKNNSTELVKVKIKYTNELVNHSDLHFSNVSIGLGLRDLHRSFVNPITTENALIFIFAVSLTVYFLLKKKKQQYAGVAAILLFLIPTIVFAKDDVLVNLTFDNINLKARNIEYRVIIDNGDNNPQEIIRTYGDEVGTLPEINPKEGYNPTGWVDQNNVQVTENTVVTDELVITPNYDPIKYTITYDIGDGTLEGENPTEYTVEDEFTLNNPTVPGYTFAGWAEGSTLLLQTNVTIYKGTIGNKTFTAFYSANQDTVYTVIHRKMNMEGEYEETEREELHGATDTNVTPQPKNYPGFKKPQSQTQKIDGDGSTIFTYDYEREKYTLNITDRTNLDETSTPNGEYYYDTDITLIAKEKVGYTFRWSDGDTSLTKTFKLSENITLTPEYTPNQDTPYKVIHKTMNLDGETYSVRDEDTFYGTTDTEVEPNTNIYEGFTAPAKQTINIDGNGQAKVEYLYTRNQYTLTITDPEYVETTTPSNSYYYGTSITLKAKNRTSYHFVKWSNDNTNPEITFELKDNTTIGPIYAENSYVVTFNYNGGEGEETTRLIEPRNALGELPVPNERTNYYFDGWYTNLIGGEKVTSGYIPTGDIELTAKWIKSVEAMKVTNPSIVLDVEDEENISISNANEIEETYTFTSNDESIATVDSNGKVTGIAIGETIITIEGNKSHKTKTINVTVLSNEYAVTFVGNGGEPESQIVTVRKGQSINELPTVIRDKYFLDGWYTDMQDGIKIENGYTPTQNVTLYAKWKKAITSAIITNTDIELETEETVAIAITNANEIEEDYTFESADEDIATVDQNGNITGISAGTTTITIRGNDSNATVTINVTVTQTINHYVVHFNANGGTGTMADQAIDYNVATNLNRNTFVRDNYTFNGWNTQADGEGESYTNQQEVTNLTDETEITLYAQWEMIPFPYVFRQDGACMFNGSSGNITGTECSRFTNGKYIDTGVKLYSAENHDKDYEIGFTIDEYIPADNPSQATLMNTKNEASGYPGVVYRKRDNTFELASRRTSSANSFIYPELTTRTVRIYRINSEIYYSLDGGERIKLNDLSEYNPVFDLNVWFGAAPTNGSATTGQRFFKGTLSNLYIRLGTFTDDSYYRTTLEPNGGTVEPPYVETLSGQEIGELPTPTKPLHTFLGWYTGITEGVRVMETYVPRNDSTIYARWQKKPTYQITVEENGGIEVPDFEIETGTAIGNLPITEKEGYNLEGWYLNEELTTRINSTYIPTGNTTIYAKWVNTAFPKVFEQRGSCTFNGSDANITGDACSNYLDQKYIDTGIALYSEENINKDYEIGFEIESYNPNNNTAQATLMNAKLEANSYPGIVFRRKDSTTNLDLISRKTSSANETVSSLYSDVTSVKVYRISGKIYYSINGSEKTFLHNLTEFNPTFDQTVWFGAAPTNGTGTTAQRHLNGTLKNMYIKLGDYELNGKFKVSYNVNGGDELETSYKHISIGETIGTLPTPVREGYYFDGWYTSLDNTGQQIDENYTPTNSINLYAHWRKSIVSMNIENDQIVMRTIEDEDINISNTSEIEEEWTYTSSNPAVATVDQNGKVTAVGVGETEITITGTTSSQTIPVYVNVYPEYDVTYDAQTGQFNNNETTNVIHYGLASKNSRTENVAADGKQISSYANQWNESNIVGSSRGNISNAHVIKFPDADKIRLDIYYGTAYYYYDYVTVWQGSHPEYKASADYSLGISELTKLGGYSSSTQIINGNSVQKVNYKKTDITGNSLTIGFVSTDESSSYYGYYALAKWLNTIDGSYEEPTKDGAEFLGWYKDAECTDGQQFDPYNITSDTTAYAKWGHTITYNGNGGSTPSPSSVEVPYQNEIGTLPTTTRTGYYFDGWYTTTDNTGEKVESNYIPTSNITLYAHWKKSVGSMTFETSIQRVERTQQADINIINASEIEEEYTFESSNTSIAAIDNTGMITGNALGDVTITIRGKTSNHTKTLKVQIVPRYDVTYDANGGKYSDDTTTKIVPYRLLPKYSRTYNISETGAKNSDYANNSGNSYIRGTGRDNSSSSAHVITFPKAEKLYIDLYYATYNKYYDKLGMIAENSPSYSVSHGSSSTANTYGGYCQGTTVILNGNKLSNVCHKLYTTNGESVSFAFHSYDIGSSNKYGYYAIVKGISNTIEVEEPTKDNMTFFGWYKNPECTDGQEFQNKDSNIDMTVYAKWGYRITYDVNGGTSVSPETKDFVLGDTIGTLPTPTKEGYYFDGWYTSLDISGEKVTSNYVPTGSITLYAKWKKSVASITTDPASIITGVTLEEPINITNASEIEEEYTFESGNTSIATVDQTGTITGIAPGETTITIRGLSSNQTKTIQVKVLSAGIITYDANGGIYSDNTTVKRKLAISKETKYSHTQNIDDTGKQNSNYAHNWNNSNIRGTDRTTSSSNAHVITIPGASQLTVDVYHNGESCCDYLYIWKGSHPNYTASTSDSTNKITSFYMGTYSTTYTVNGNILTNMGYHQYTVPGDTVTFSFKSDGSNYGNGYGYYAIVTAEGTSTSFEEPTKENMVFYGWYKDPECSDGQEFEVGSNTTEDITVYAKWVYQITYDVNGGSSISTNSKIIGENKTIGELPSTTKSGYYLDGWYTSLDATGEKVTSDYVPTSNITLYAKWKKSVASMSVSSTLSMYKLFEQTINISNASEIEEEWTYTSSKPSVATVDANGKVTAVSAGTATITITGVSSGHTKTITVTVTDAIVVSYYANGGTFSGNTTVNRLAYESTTKYSYTQNVSDTGKKNSNYGNKWTNSNIRGTNRTSASSNAHVITIPGATSLSVTIYYNGQGTSYDWATVWSGSHSNYTASSNYSSGISGATKLGGSCSNSYVVNGNSLTNICKKTLTVSDSSVTFGFRSDSSGYGKGYGYYAIVTGTSKTGTYKEPTNSTGSFLGWYKDQACTAGQEFNETNITQDYNVYAKWGYQVTYNVNGGSSVSQTSKTISANEAIGTLPSTTKSGYYLDGWYTSLDATGEKVTSSYVPTSNVTLYAKWKKSVASMSVSSTLSVNNSQEKTINITNASEIEEEWTYSSSNTSVATVDSNGKVTGISAGTATITIRGAKSNHTKTITVTVTAINTITYNSSDGKFEDNTTTNQVIYSGTPAYSHTQNIDDTGKKNSDYGDSWTNSNIRGTGRTSSSSNAHVVTISGAQKLLVTIYYSGESTSYDWATVWAGNQPSYTAKSNYSSGIEGAQKLGGECYDTYVVNGNTLSNVCKKIITISGSSVSFGYRTDNGGHGNGFGYYAVINGITGTYKEPVKEGANFLGWYTDAECSVGQEFTSTNINRDYTLYALLGNQINLNVNGGDAISPATKKVKTNEPVGDLPTPTRTNYYFDGWYTSTDTSGIKITADYIPTTNMTVYAKWRNSVEIMTIDDTTIDVGQGLETNINITNASSIEEDYSFTSSDTSIATVDQNGKIKGITPGTTTVTIRGIRSNKTIQVTVVVSPRSIITYNANGGTFTNNRTTIDAVQGSTVTKYSYTENVNGVGYKNDDFGNNWSNSNIRGTGRTSASSNAHVVTIPGAKQLTIDIYYGVSNSSTEWLSIWQGSHPSYTATSNYSSGIEESQKIGGYCSYTYTVNGTTINNVCKKTITVNGDTVTFGFTSGSDNTNPGYKYGYYAIVKDANMQHTYEEPTKDNAGFLGWYKDSECTDGQEYDDSETTGSMTVYAKWGYRVYYHVNGGTTFYPNDIRLDKGEPLGSLTTPKKTGFYFIGWYTSTDSSGIQVDENYIPTSSMYIYARWRKAVTSMNISPSTIYLGRTISDQINITNASEIEEEWTYSSSDTSIVTVDQNGKVTGIAPGNAMIYIHGTTSNQVKEIPIVVQNRGVITYNANGGKFSDNETTHKAIQGASVVKYSHTSNIDDAGRKYNDYGNNWTNANITGTERGNTSSAHVVTIPNAQKLSVEVYYSTEGSSYDWLTIWKGNYPSYTALNNYNSNYVVQKLGGKCSNTYTINGHTLTDMCRSTYTVTGNTVTFGFRSNETYVGTGYGYYVIVRDANIPYTYEEPTKENAGFLGWYTNSSCTAGQEYDDTATTSDRTVYAKWGYKVYFDVNGGNALNPNEKGIGTNETIGELPTPEREGYYLDGWYTTLDTTGEKVSSNYKPTANVTLYAKWKKSVQYMNIEPNFISIDRGVKKQINITNISEIEENYTFTSSNTSVATVNQNGVVTGISNGETTITITGQTSNQTVTIPVNVYGNILITYDANGGTFSNNETINTTSSNATNPDVVKYSHTQNIDDTGKQNSNYGTYWGNANITGTDRGNTSQAHVVTIPGASQLIVDIYYNGYSYSTDYVSVWQGSHPSYSAYSNYSSAMTGAQRLGGPGTGTYEVNGNTLTNMNHKTLNIMGNTVTFSYRSDNSYYGKGYGYYAIVKDATQKGTYEEPTRNNYSFAGWYKDSPCTDGQEFTDENVTQDITLYAKWDYKITFDINGGDELVPSYKGVPQGQPIGELPIPIRTGYYFDGWYSSLDINGVRIEKSVVPSSGMTIYAKWKKSVASLEIDPTEVIIETGEEETINISNASEIDEDFSLVSNDESIASIDQNGKVTGIANGETTITITGQTSNQTIIIPVYITKNYKITYDANGGKFSNDETTKVVSYSNNFDETSQILKYSHTENVDDTGKRNNSYGNGWSNNNIRGTGRTTASSEAHVISFPGAIKLEVELYFNGESASYDWVSVWEGSHPDYTASSNHSSAISNAQRLGGAQTGTYTVNGNTLTNMGHLSLEVNGDTVTFGFTSDGSYVGEGYGYYAIVRGIKDIADIYEEPTKDNKTFVGWYKDSECSDGQKYNSVFDIETTHVYAAWANIITFDTNGGSALTTPTKILLEGRQIGTLPTSTKEGYYLDGWYTSLDSSGIKVTDDYIPTSNETLYAKWKKSVWNIVQSPPEITLIPGEEQTITVTNPEDFEEEYTYESSSNSIATVDENGKVTAVAAGSTTINIRGVKSNQTKSVSVTVDPEYTVTYDASGGTFESGESTNQVSYGKTMIKYSHTSNIDDLGRKLSDYGNNWNNESITGTDRGNTSKAHVVTIPNAKTLSVEVYYNTQDYYYDWVNVWEGNHPDYTATNNSSIGYRLGGSYTNTYTVNGRQIKNVYKATYTISGDTVTFGFTSNDSEIGGGYGYYAIVKGKQNEGRYEEPTKPDLNFYGWYTNPECTQTYNDGSTTGTRTVYAGYSYTITYDVNGGNNLSTTTKQIKQGSKIGSLSNTSRSGYYFDGWYTEQTGGEKLDANYIPTNNMTIYAHWKKSVAGMTFEKKNFTISIGQQVPIVITNLSEIEEEFIFKNYYSNFDSNYATVDENGIITGRKNGSSYVYIYGKTSGQTYYINVTVQIMNYDVTLDSNGGDINYTLNYKSNESLATLPVPKKNNHTFMGWYTGLNDGVLVDENYILTGNITLYARWSDEMNYNISFDSNGGTKVNDITVEDGHAIGTLPTPQKNQKQFVGWYTGLTDGTIITSTYQPSSDMTLYARWEDASTYTITLDPNEGILDGTTIDVYGGTPIGELPIPTRDNYYFDGWLDVSTNNYYYSTTIPTGNVTLVAQWNEQDYVARINSNYYSSISSAIESAEANDRIILLKNTTENITNDKNIILDLNSKTLTGMITNSENSTLTIVNGSIENNGKIISNSGTIKFGCDDFAINDTVNITYAGVSSANMFVIEGGNIIVNKADINATALEKSVGMIYAIKANQVTVNGGTITVNNNSTSSANIIGTLNSNAKITINDGILNASAKSFSSWGIYDVSENSSVVMNGGTMNITTPANNSVAVGIELRDSTKGIVVMNGGTINCSAPNFRAFGIHNDEGSYYNIIMNGGRINTDATTSSSYGIVNNKGGSNIIINGGTIYSKNGGTSVIPTPIYNYNTSSSVYINGGNIISESVDNKSYAYGVYNSESSQKLYFNGGTIKLKGIKTYLLNGYSTTNYVLPNGKQLSKTGDADEFTVYTLTNG